jgi:hypothetical protein
MPTQLNMKKCCYNAGDEDKSNLLNCKCSCHIWGLSFLKEEVEEELEKCDFIITEKYETY